MLYFFQFRRKNISYFSGFLIVPVFCFPLSGRVLVGVAFRRWWMPWPRVESAWWGCHRASSDQTALCHSILLPFCSWRNWHCWHVGFIAMALFWYGFLYYYYYYDFLSLSFISYFHLYCILSSSILSSSSSSSLSLSLYSFPHYFFLPRWVCAHLHRRLVWGGGQWQQWVLWCVCVGQ